MIQRAPRVYPEKSIAHVTGSAEKPQAFAQKSSSGYSTAASAHYRD
jgi:hypothetical protein